MSGRPGYQSSEYQDQKSTGPIPEGTYVARQEQLQFMDLKGLIVGSAVVVKEDSGGKWPGSYYSWVTLVFGWNRQKKLTRTVAIILVSMAECGRALPGVLI